MMRVRLAPGSPPGGDRPDLGSPGHAMAAMFVILAGHPARGIHDSRGAHPLTRVRRASRPGTPIPPLRLPMPSGDHLGKWDVATHADEGQAGKVPACSERGPAILNICQLYERGPSCWRSFSMPARAPGPSRISSDSSPSSPRSASRQWLSKKTLPSVAHIVRSKQLTLPVGVDTDGRLGGRYAMVSLSPDHIRLSRWCSAEPGATLASPASPRCARVLAGLLAASRARGWKRRHS